MNSWATNSEVETIVRFAYRGRNVAFCIASPDDYIQKIQSTGAFYEASLLERLSNLIPRAATILDIGANVGNHSVFFGLFTAANRVVPFEPNPQLAAIVKRNAELNKLINIDFSALGCALSSRAYEARIHVPNLQNWGNGRLIPSAQLNEPTLPGFTADIKVRPLDSFTFENVDFIKIDVEGHETEVLAGARATITKHRPCVFIETGGPQMRSVNDYMTEFGYSIIDCFISYRGLYNYLYVPIR